jgi:hypothetical protein
MRIPLEHLPEADNVEEVCLYSDNYEMIVANNLHPTRRPKLAPNKKASPMPMKGGKAYPETTPARARTN